MVLCPLWVVSVSHKVTTFLLPTAGRLGVLTIWGGVTEP